MKNGSICLEKSSNLENVWNFPKINFTFFELWCEGPVDEEERFGGIFDGHEMTEDGFPKVAQIAYAKHILGFYKII